MYGEFCIVLRKNSLTKKNSRVANKFSLIEADDSFFKLGNIDLIIRSYESSISFDNNTQILFGDAIYNNKLIQKSNQLNWNDTNTLDFKSEARGSWALIELFINSGKIEVATDPLGLYPIYIYEDEDIVVVSNLPLWIEDILASYDIVIERDGLLAAYEIAIGTGAFGVTAWSKIRLLDLGSRVLLSQTNLKINKYLLDDRFFNKSLSISELLNKGEQDLKENVSAIANSTYDFKVSDITGGKDSRLVLAAIMNQGLQNHYLFNTQGEHPMTDANSALNIISKLSLRRVKWRNKYKAPIGLRPIYACKSFLHQSQGMRFFYDRAFETNIEQKNIIKVGGGLAGGFKSTFSLRVSKDKCGDLSLQEAVDSMFLSSAKYIDEEIISSIRNNLYLLFKEIKEKHTVSYRTVMDFFYVLSRNRYFIGVGEFPNSAIRPKVHALYSESLIMAAIKMSDKDRASGLIHYKLISNLYHDLLNFPFADKGWTARVVTDPKLSNLIDNSINHKSPKLYNDISEYIVDISACLNNDSNLTVNDENYCVDEVWRNKQRELGRRWLWCYFDNIHSATKFMLSDYNILILSKIVKKDFINNILNKDHNDYNNPSDVRMVISVLIYLLFQDKKEIVTFIKRE